MTKPKAVVAGALGVIGRTLVEHLCDRDWEVVGLSRRCPDFDTPARFLAVDLLDREAAEATLSSISDATHLFFAAFQYRTSWVEHTAPNLALLVNTVEALARASPTLVHVNLAQGTKFYGAHLGPFKTPARESDPPHMSPSFYLEQQRWLEAHAGRWAWSAVRPHTVCGYARGNPMNLINVIAAYALISKELGLPLRYPGKEGAYRSVYQLSDARLLARAMEWCALSPAARNEAFNVTNGDYMRWENVWPRIAEFFDMPVGPVQTIPTRAVHGRQGTIVGKDSAPS
jgi:nucleoside-diphosphate-sugar epimerase